MTISGIGNQQHLDGADLARTMPKSIQVHTKSMGEAIKLAFLGGSCKTVVVCFCDPFGKEQPRCIKEIVLGFAKHSACDKLLEHSNDGFRHKQSTACCLFVAGVSASEFVTA